MKMIIVIMTALLVQASAAGFAQKLTYVKKNASLKQLFSEIKKQTGYDVLWLGKDLDIGWKINANFRQAGLDEVMQKSLEDLKLSYTIEDKNIVIKKKEPSITSVILNSFQNLLKDLNVKGRVVDQDGKPLPNASIRVKGKSAVTNTNAEGEFEIKNVADDAVVLVSYVGFRTLELPLKDAVMPLEIKLNVATGELEEVKVVYNTGYQELNKERATGSFVQLSNKDINRVVSTNILDRILNQTNSLRNEITGTRGDSQISIRGLSTINATRRPLIVIDGFPYEEGNQTVNIDINNLNPNDDKGAGKGAQHSQSRGWGKGVDRSE